MCGIAGCFLFRPEEIDHNWLKSIDKSVQSIMHRGPDESGSWHGNNMYLGMRRLSIIDLSGGSQPIWNEDKSCCIVFNGELYNYLDLRPQLQGLGHTLSTQSDTEVVLHAYTEWGEKCLEHLLGMFAFAIWDGKKEQLFVARDRIGEKPLYYYQDNSRLVFASEIKAILADKTIVREIAPQGMANFFAYGHAVAPDTIYCNIRKLLPGHYMLINGDGVRFKEYWEVGQKSIGAHLQGLSEEEWCDQIVDLLDDSVRRQMIADVPLGAFLSGGVDSSAVVSLMQKHASAPVKTFSLGFNVGGAYNELEDARNVAKALKTEHHELNVEHYDLVETLKTLVYHYDEPYGDAACFPLYLLSKFARQHVKVVLSGDGGDELFGGYRRYGFDRLSSYYQKIPSWLSCSFIPWGVEKLPRFRRSKRALSTLPIKNAAERYAKWLMLFSPDMQNELINQGPWKAAESYDVFRPYKLYYNKLADQLEHDHLNQLMYVDFKTWLVDTYMEKTDKATMACSLEARLPILDHRMVDLAFRIPSSYKISGFQLKKIFKQAVSRLVPDFVLKKPKHGFAVPTDLWFRGDLKDYTFEILLDDQARKRGYFKMDFIEKLWKEHTEGRHVWDSHLWLLLNFELWHRIYMDKEGV